MTLKLRPRYLIAAGLLILAASSWYLLRRPSPAQLLENLPAGDAPILYVDVAALRQTGLLDLIAGKAGAEEPEYKKFVASSGFDYRRHLDGVMLCPRRTDTLIIVSGRFDDVRLAGYAKASGGRCAGELCSVQGSVPQRQISWLPLSRGVMGLAVSPDPMAAAGFSGKPAPAPFPIPEAAVWLHVPGSQLRGGEGFPPGLSALLSALRGADRAMFAAVPDGQSFALTLEAPCSSDESAAGIAGRLSNATDMLKKLLARENRQPDTKDLSGVLAGGTFQTNQNLVLGRWPVSRAFLDALIR